MIEKTVAELSAALASGEITSVELTRAYLDRIALYNTELNAYITVCEESALEQARIADEQRAAGSTLPLLGIPIAHKDLFCTKGVLTTSGSKILHNFISPYDATVVERMQAAGAVMLGKTNMDEFAMGSSNESSYYGAARNPWDIDKVPGGSSGGSAAAVAADLCAMATGTDTGGSIRQPAAFCGITGIKPSYGRISRWGMIAYASSLDQAGPLCKSAEDAALLLNVMAGVDDKDSTSLSLPAEDFTASLNESLDGLKIGLPKQHFAEGLDAGIDAAIRNAIAELEALGATVKEIDLPNSDLAISAYYVIAPAEASANLSRFDGVRYGYRCENPVDLEDMYKRSRSEGFGDEVKRRIMVGTYALSAGFYDAYYRKAQKIRRLVKEDYARAFEDVDVIIGPTTPSPAFGLDSIKDSVTMYLEDIYTIALNLAGLPGISVPAGFVDGLPVGMQIVATDFAEAKLLNVAHQFQKVTDWHRRKPTLRNATTQQGEA
jgi:aspartyl-tRNA(Asn)/glutamyl-tRNA(Gln) amidotransferase subunit A